MLLAYQQIILQFSASRFWDHFPSLLWVSLCVLQGPGDRGWAPTSQNWREAVEILGWGSSWKKLDQWEHILEEIIGNWAFLVWSVSRSHEVNITLPPRGALLVNCMSCSRSEWLGLDHWLVSWAMEIENTALSSRRWGGVAYSEPSTSNYGSGTPSSSMEIATWTFLLQKKKKKRSLMGTSVRALQ